MKTSTLLSATLLLLLGIFWMSAARSNQTPFSVQVSAPNGNRVYKTHAAVKGSLFGGLVRLQQANQGFNFTYTPNDDYGPFLQSVNTLAGNSSHYWALLSGKTMLSVGCDQTPFSMQVDTPTDNKSYNTYAAYRGSLFGRLVRLKFSNQGFDFTYTPNDDYGPFLQSVNGLAGDSSHYWELLSYNTMLDVGMGCYLPKANEVITLKYTRNHDRLISFNL